VLITPLVPLILRGRLQRGTSLKGQITPNKSGNYARHGLGGYGSLPHNPLYLPYPEGRQLKTGKDKTHPQALYVKHLDKPGLAVIIKFKAILPGVPICLLTK
jgi:hypothetical protein